MATAKTKTYVKMSKGGDVPKAPVPKTKTTQTTEKAAAMNSPLPVTVIAKDAELQNFLDKRNNSFALPGSTIGVYFPLASQCYSDANQDERDQVIAIVISSTAPDEGTAVLLISSLSKTRIITGLSTLLEDPSVVKVMYKIHQAAYCLHTYGLENPTLVNCVDLQLLYESRVKTTVLNADMNQIISYCSQERKADQAQTLHSYKACLDRLTTIHRTKLELHCELEPLLDLLPLSYRDAILNIDNYHSRLVDVVVDEGKIPIVYTGKRQRIELSQDEVSKETITEILVKLGGEMRIGNDNRAGIDRQLHRISVMRSKTDDIYAYTMRVGRALRNAACVLTDLLLSSQHANKSVLVLGHPGSGKTTLIRDMARFVSETKENVCIIDTSNEIGGDGLIPHKCVGWSRRMMVKSLEAQAGVMVECVQNHTVETLVVDEIGRKPEVLSASTVRQRGPRLIASAHGDFRALIKNPELKGLVGGSQQVTVGDAEAKASNKGKLQTQRAGNPIFDVIVELDHVVRGRCQIIWDVAKAVDTVLEHNCYSFETRRWDVNTRGVQVIRN
ncbi:hypothetical protein PHMEG_00015068 [Phytophthora megakarya]|uniref:AAA+ ATPase domain-containing protein n=1 Tax=Phytophthora megakarya TaxID=4795 RepID=A0A225W4S4_9STRA|nr:hypothetical protein PHMEG_00015068 [Phytophthora megakarya]